MSPGSHWIRMFVATVLTALVVAAIMSSKEGRCPETVVPPVPDFEVVNKYHLEPKTQIHTQADGTKVPHLMRLGDDGYWILVVKYHGHRGATTDLFVPKGKWERLDVGDVFPSSPYYYHDMDSYDKYGR